MLEEGEVEVAVGVGWVEGGPETVDGEAVAGWGGGYWSQDFRTEGEHWPRMASQWPGSQVRKNTAELAEWERAY